MNEHTKDLHEVGATWDGYELDFSMSMAGLSALRDCFRDLSFGTYRLGATSGEDTSEISILNIRPEAGRLEVTVGLRQAQFSGSPESMYLLAENMEALSTLWAAGGDQHFHFDPSSDEILLAPGSKAFILSPKASRTR